MSMRITTITVVLETTYAFTIQKFKDGLKGYTITSEQPMKEIGKTLPSSIAFMLRMEHNTSRPSSNAITLPCAGSISLHRIAAIPVDDDMCDCCDDCQYCRTHQNCCGNCCR